jgi:tetratricopeptide (TPR) repeat protein
MQIFRQALNLWEQLENERGMANACNNMGIIYDYRGQFDKSVEQYSQALELRRTIHDTIGLADAYNNLSVVYHYRGLY